MHPIARPSAKVWRIALLAAALLYGLGACLEVMLEQWLRAQPLGNAWMGISTGVVFVAVWFGVPIAAFAIPCAVLAWLGVAMASRHCGTRGGRLLAVSIGVAAGVFVVGKWLAGLYGLDPPYSLYFLGA